MVITTGDNYVGAAEPQLREKLGALYSKIAQGFAPPTNAEKDNMKLLVDRFGTQPKPNLRKSKVPQWRN